MRLRLLLLVAFAMGHVGLVLGGALGVCPVPLESALAKGILYYGALSGSSNGYGFFAPSVSSTVRATFTMTAADGRTWTDTLERGASHEADMRINGAVCMSAYFTGSHREASASWAATMFGRHPEAQKVEVCVEVHDLPTMAEYQAGGRPEWLTEYRVTFSRELTPGETSPDPSYTDAETSP